MYHIPRLIANIVSLGELEEAGFKIVMVDGALKAWDPLQRLVAVVWRGANRLHVLSVTVDKPVSLAAHAEEMAWRWHARYGHLGFHGLQKLSKGEMVHGLPRIEQVYRVCNGRLVDKKSGSRSRWQASTGRHGSWSWSTPTCAARSHHQRWEARRCSCSSLIFLDIGYQIRPLHLEMYKAKSYKRREKKRKATVL
jgi:hypothetical protein